MFFCSLLPDFVESRDLYDAECRMDCFHILSQCLRQRPVLPAWTVRGHTSPLTQATPTERASRFFILTKL